MNRLTLRNPYTTLIAIFAAFLITLSAQAAPTFVNAANPELPDVARGVPMGGALEVHDIDLDQVGSSDLALERFRVFDTSAELNVDNQYSVAPPTDAYFRGRVAALPDSIVVLAVPERGPVRGVITDASGVWLLAGKSGHSAPGLSNRKVDLETELAGMPFECGAEGAAFAPADLIPENGGTGPDTAPLGTNVTHTARVAVETDYEYYAKFGNVTVANQYMADVFAYASTVYEREVNTNLVISWSRLWTGGAASDPWTVERGDANQTTDPYDSDTQLSLYEFRNYWNANDPDGANQHTIAHMLSGKSLGGGIAYVGVLCNSSYGYGLSASLGGTFNIGNPSVVWDLLVVAHEIGHNFSSSHTHDYCGNDGVSDPVDLCYTSNSCGSGQGLPGINSLSGGTTSEKPGTIMSYCHLVSGGYSNISFTFGQNHIYGRVADRVPNQMYSHVTSVANGNPSCLALIADGPVLSVSKEGAGSGRVTSSPAGIDCGATCSANYSTNESVTLQAVADADSEFVSWGGDCNSISGQVTLDTSKTCTATFDLLPPVPVLTVTKDGSGSGTVTSNPAGIVCGTDCNEPYDNLTVFLSAAPANGSAFSGWGGACAEDGSVLVDSDKTCTATFDSLCGNGQLDGGEACDGALLAPGIDCDGCVGTPTCTASCTVDTSSCYNGTCDPGEDCNSCGQDCISGSFGGAVCGNGICEASDGEDCGNCATDCAGRTTGKPSSRFCCGESGCGNSACNSGGYQCTTDQAEPSEEYCCGDSACEGEEDSSSCGVDCSTPPPPPFCGDGVCDGDETQFSCSDDCGTPPSSEAGSCDDGIDNDGDGDTDCADSDCADDPVCDIPPEVCDDGSDNDGDGLTDCADSDCSNDPACQVTCAPRGAACSSNDECCTNSCHPRKGTCK